MGASDLKAEMNLRTPKTLRVGKKWQSNQRQSTGGNLPF